MKIKPIWLVIGLLVAAGAVGWAWQSTTNQSPTNTPSTTSNTAGYHPIIRPQDFVASITNPFFTLKPGATFTYQTQTDTGTERIEIVVTSATKQIMGVTTTQVQDTVHVDTVLVEDTKDWYAQDQSGNVWYFGEAVDNYEGNQLKDHTGSWEAGVAGAQPGIIMKAHPKIGDSYRQEYSRGVAEDMADVVALDQTVAVPAGTFQNCLQTRDWSQLDPNLNEYKYYCAAVGGVVQEEDVAGGPGKTQLVRLTTP